MNPLQLFCYFILNFLVVEGIDSPDPSIKEDLDHVSLTNKSETKEQEFTYVDIDVAYDILEKPGLRFDVPTEFSANEYVTFNFTLKNLENYNITVTGIAGSVVSNPGGFQVANISEQVVGPYDVPTNGTLYFQTAIQLILPEGPFYLAPLLSINGNDEPMRLGIRPLSIFVTPPPMSFFNPAFLSVQIILAIVVGILTISFIKYFGSNPKKEKKISKTQKIDESWLPEVHKK